MLDGLERRALEAAPDAEFLMGGGGLYGTAPDTDSANAAFTDWRELPRLLNGSSA